MNTADSYHVSVLAPTGDPHEVVRLSEAVTGGWVIYRCSRDAVSRQREKLHDLGSPGVYLLFGGISPAGRTWIYIGQGDPVSDRLESHLRSKGFWTDCVFIVSPRNELHSGHIKRVEAILIAEARSIDHLDMSENKVNPANREAPLEVEFVAGKIVRGLYKALALFGLDYRQPIAGQAALIESSMRLPCASVPEASPSALFSIRARGIVAYGDLNGSGFLVRSGSQMAPSETPTLQASARRRRKALLEDGSVVARDGKLVFVRDVDFPSCSGASQAVLGRSSSGNDDWKTVQGLSLKEWRAACSSVAAEQ